MMLLATQMMQTVLPEPMVALRESVCRHLQLRAQVQVLATRARSPTVTHL
jgi:hypothetical protein